MRDTLDCENPDKTAPLGNCISDGSTVAVVGESFWRLPPTRRTITGLISLLRSLRGAAVAPAGHFGWSVEGSQRQVGMPRRQMSPPHIAVRYSGQSPVRETTITGTLFSERPTNFTMSSYLPSSRWSSQTTMEISFQASAVPLAATVEATTGATEHCRRTWASFRRTT